MRVRAGQRADWGTKSDIRFGSPCVPDDTQTMFLQDGKYLCVLCGEHLDVSPEQRPLTFIKAASGEPNMRTISLDGTEIHACPFTPESAASPA